MSKFASSSVLALTELLMNNTRVDEACTACTQGQW